MLIGAAGPPARYTDPWLADYDTRLRALGAGGRRVAYYAERPHPHTFRYRVFNMVQALEADPSRGISAAWFTGDDAAYGAAFVERADVLVLSRARYDHHVGRLIARARARGVTVLFDIDDLMFDTAHAHLIADIIGRKLHDSAQWDIWFGEIARLGATLRLCDGAVTTNAMLADRIAAFAPGIGPCIAPNFLNREQQAVSRPIMSRKIASGFERDVRVHVGYFSGTNSHNGDFAIAADAVARLMAVDRRIVLRIVGPLDLPRVFEGLAERVERVALQDFVNLQRVQGEVEICLAPVQDTVFTQCKSALKYFEAAAVGGLTIASPSHAFAAAIRDGETGFLARAHDWEARIGAAIALLDDDPLEYEALAGRASADAETRYGHDRQAAVIEAAVFGRPDSAEGRDGSHHGALNA